MQILFTCPHKDLSHPDAETHAFRRSDRQGLAGLIFSTVKATELKVLNGLQKVEYMGGHIKKWSKIYGRTYNRRFY